MQNYLEFLQQYVDFPQDGFEVIDDELYFHDINLMEVLETYGSPLRITYLPIISKKIKQSKLYFQNAFLKHDYRGSYTYCYCTKSSHFRYVMEEALKNDVHLEISSGFDVPLVETLEKRGLISKNTLVVANGCKRDSYKQALVDLMHDGFTNIIPVLDHKEELNFYLNEVEGEFKLGVRVAIEEQPNFSVYTSRLGIRPDDILDLYKDKIRKNDNVKLTMLHFFINSGIADTPYYWNELDEMIELYCELKKLNPELTQLNIGGGMPFRNSMAFDFDYEYVISEIVRRVKAVCSQHDVLEPDIITEFGSYTVAESSAILFRVLTRKQQNDREKWLMLDGSLMTTLPDIWAINQRYILLPINNWDAEYERVYLGGITCDGHDFYGNDAQKNEIYMPRTRKVQYVGFFHTGAYQESLSGVGGIHHCLIPTPRHIIISRRKDETLNIELFAEEQNSKQVLKILGY